MASSLQELSESRQGLPASQLTQPPFVALVAELQARLCALGFLDPVIDGSKEAPFLPVRPADGRFGPETFHAIKAFHRYCRLHHKEGQLAPAFFQALFGYGPDALFPVQFNPRPEDDGQTLLAKRVLRYMARKNYWITRAPDQLNIVYVEGAGPDGKPNADPTNKWNDRRMVIRILPGGQPEMLVNDQATTEPGRFYINNPMHASGAARIAFGQYKAWKMGLHRGTQPALVQRGKVRLHRDINKDGKRDAADPIDIGYGFGINQHSTRPGLVPGSVEKFSAGCLVGRRYDYHLSFLHIVRQDYRYQMNKDYMFISTVIDGDDLAKAEPA
ncbi:MAG: peptidoglycan-binding protein [Phaeodactylibacter sp.]|nr:peptidoglycan-binding protein [Phaeodactylibacter sp.]MCB9292667.1 peptidoglycan-binding protein [Lewinellaceae bacterium]